MQSYLSFSLLCVVSQRGERGVSFTLSGDPARQTQSLPRPDTDQRDPRDQRDQRDPRDPRPQYSPQHHRPAPRAVERRANPHLNSIFTEGQGSKL